MDSTDRTEGAGNGGGPVDEDLAGALAGDELAQRRLVERLTPIIQARVGRVLLRAGPYAPPRQAVEDFTQEVFMILFKADARTLRDWDPDRGLSLEDFVGLVARRHACSVLRSDRRNPWFEQTVESAALERPSAEAGPERRSAARERVRLLLDRFRAELSPLGWRLFDLLFLREHTVEEVRRITNLSDDAVYAWKSRLRRKARQFAQAFDEEREHDPTPAAGG